MLQDPLQLAEDTWQVMGAAGWHPHLWNNCNPGTGVQPSPRVFHTSMTGGTGTLKYDRSSPGGNHAEGMKDRVHAPCSAPEACMTPPTASHAWPPSAKMPSNAGSGQTRIRCVSPEQPAQLQHQQLLKCGSGQHWQDHKCFLPSLLG